MKAIISMRVVLPAIVMAFTAVSAAQAASNRTFISSGGFDTNTSASCPRANPCRTFAAALGVTTPGGEVVALDSAGYGSATVTNGISLIGPPDGAYITLNASTTGYTINSPGNTVILRNIQINGANAANTVGVSVLAGRLVLQNSTLKNLTTGLTVAANTQTDVIDTDIIHNTTGIETTGTGDDGSFPINGPTQVHVAGGNVLNNTTAFVMNAPGENLTTIFLFATENSNTLYETNIAGNGTMVTGGNLIAYSNGTNPNQSLP